MNVRLKVILSAVVGGLAGLAAAVEHPPVGSQPAGSAAAAEQFVVVDCLLPGKVKRLGNKITYLEQRRPARLTAEECTIRGGEYTSYDRADIHTSLSVWQPLAEAGDSEAQTYVGEIFDKGFGGLAPNYPEAVKWYRKAADAGSKRAKINLALLYEKGFGVPRDPVQASKLYAEAYGVKQSVVLEQPSTRERDEETQQLRSQLDDLRKQLDQARALAREDALRASAERDRLQKELGAARQSGDARTEAEVARAIQAREQRLAQEGTRVQDLEASVERQKSLVEKLERDNAELKGRLGQLEQRLADAEKARSEEQSKSAALQASLQSARAESDQTRAQIEDARRQVAQAESNARNRTEEAAGRQSQAERAAQAALEEARRQVQVESAARAKAEETARQHAQAEALARAQADEARAQAEEARRQAQSESAARARAEDAARRQAQAESEARAHAEEARAQAEEARKHAQAESAARARAEEAARIQAQKAETVSRTDIERLQARLDEQARLVKQREQELEAVNKNVERLTGEIREAQSRLQKAKGPQVAAAPPSIELIDPSLPHTRGEPVIVLRGAVKSREILGRVTAPAGLMSFTVNDRSEVVGVNGLFKTNVQIPASPAKVNLVAVDTQGQKAKLDFSLSIGEIEGAKPLAARPPPIPDEVRKAFSVPYALVIGNQHYQRLPSLDTAVEDAREISTVLAERYGYRVTTLIDATRYQVLSELNSLRRKLTENDNLLVYYAGHGELDRANQRAFWQPVDAEADSDANWISSLVLTDIFNAMTTKHILVVADSCYAGAMTRAGSGAPESGHSDEALKKWLTDLARARSRTILTSGGVEPVLDGGGGKHSVFAKVFLEVLRDNREVIDGQRLYRDISARVLDIASRLVNFNQRPLYAPIKFAGHEGGDFLFVPVKE